MLRNYVTTAFRNFKRNKGYTLINILGLTLGTTCSLLIMLWVNDELSFDKFHEKDARLYQVMRNMYQAGGEIITTNAVPQPVAVVLKNEYPEVDQVLLVSWESQSLLTRDKIVFREKGRYVSTEFFDAFSFPLLTGSPNSVLKDIQSIVISENLAVKYFASAQQAMGQTLRVNNEQDFTVTGVFKNPPENSSFQFDWLIPAEEYIKRNDWVENWGNGGFRIFLTLKEGADVAAFGKKMEQEINEHTDNQADERLFVEKFSDRYLHATYENGVSTGGRIDYVKMLLIVAVFIIVIACVNFMNLATARSVRRAQEIGLRKVMGAGKTGLGFQFLTESLVTSVISVALSALIVYLLLPWFNGFTDKTIILDLSSMTVWLVLAGLALFSGVLSGSYPALLLPSFKIVNSLKGTIKHTTGALFFRKGLVVFQFSISVLLIIGTIAVYRQMEYILSKNLGLDKENLIFIPMEGETANRFETYKAELLKISGVQSVTATSGNPLNYGRSSSSPAWRGKNPDEEVEMNILNVGPDFMKSMKMEMLRGRDFSNAPADSANFLINEEAARIMGFENPVGEAMSLWGTDGQIIGVVKNFHMSSLYEPIAPLVIRYDPPNTSAAFIRIQGNIPEALAAIEKLTLSFNPAYPFAFTFLNETYALTYRSEQVISSLTGMFAIMAIFISCLGLLGLSSFAAEQRTREIGIRKVHGATVTRLVLLLSKDYTVLIGVSFIISAPVAWYFTNHWLNRFAFRIELTGMEFILAGLTTLVIAALTVGFKSLQAASANPVNTLREK